MRVYWIGGQGEQITLHSGSVASVSSCGHRTPLGSSGARRIGGHLRTARGPPAHLSISTGVCAVQQLGIATQHSERWEFPFHSGKDGEVWLSVGLLPPQQ